MRVILKLFILFVYLLNTQSKRRRVHDRRRRENDNTTKAYTALVDLFETIQMKIQGNNHPYQMSQFIPLLKREYHDKEGS